MKTYILSFLISLMFAASANANALEEKAFNAYKNRDYKTSITLYTKAAKQKSLQAFLMLGLLYEKGIGLKQNNSKAIGLYKHILKRTSAQPRLLKNNKNRDITIHALKRLGKLTNNQKYNQLAKKILSINPIPKRNISIPGINDFFILCPSASRVAPEDREGIESFDCALFERFPDRMALFMKLRRLRFAAIQKGMQHTKQFRKLNIKIKVTIAVIIKHLQEEAISCYTNAQQLSDIKECDYNYLAKTDPFLFDNAAFKMKQASTNTKHKNHKLDIFEKNDLINAVIRSISKNTYGKPWRNVIQ